MNKYIETLLPVAADKKAIHSHWRKMWLSCVAGKGFDFLSYDSMSTK